MLNIIALLVPFILPSEGSHTDYRGKCASTTLGVNAVILQEDLGQWWDGFPSLTQVEQW